MTRENWGAFQYKDFHNSIGSIYTLLLEPSIACVPGVAGITAFASIPTIANIPAVSDTKSTH